MNRRRNPLKNLARRSKQTEPRHTLALATDTAHASGTATYTYDALGRLTATTHAGAPNDTLSQATKYDPAGNRLRFTVTGSKNVPPQGAAAFPANAPLNDPNRTK
jgi:YD repeat-containing protein